MQLFHIHLSSQTVNSISLFTVSSQDLMQLVTQSRTSADTCWMNEWTARLILALRGWLAGRLPAASSQGNHLEMQILEPHCSLIESELVPGSGVGVGSPAIYSLINPPGDTHGFSWNRWWFNRRLYPTGIWTIGRRRQKSKPVALEAQGGWGGGCERVKERETERERECVCVCVCVRARARSQV